MKYEITDIKHPLYPNLRRVRALVAIAGIVAPGELGGYSDAFQEQKAHSATK